MRALSEPIADDDGAGVTVSPMAVAQREAIYIYLTYMFKILESISTTNCSTIGLP